MWKRLRDIFSSPPPQSPQPQKALQIKIPPQTADDAEILHIFQQAFKNKVTELDLSNRGVKKVPPEIGQLTNLTTLDLRHNSFTELPPEIGKLTNLRELYLTYNPRTAEGIGRLRQLPREIGQLTNLTLLDLGGQWLLKTLPPEIGHLTKLTRLILYETELKELPSEIGKLCNLQHLDLRWTQLSTLPPEIGQLTNLTELYLASSSLTVLPSEIGLLTNLRTLRLSGLREEELSSGAIFDEYMPSTLRRLPPEIRQLTNLEELDLSYNQLSTLPPEMAQLTNLKSLNLSGNQLTTLPPEMAQLTNLKWFDLRDNPLPIPPEILHNPSAILSYYGPKPAASSPDQQPFASTAIPSCQIPMPQANLELPALAYARVVRTRPLNEAKLVLVGQERVGKTSLVKRLVEKQFDEREAITEGIAIKKWGVTVKDTEIKLNIWDFGGQEIMHATHQFFLTIRTLYVLVFDVQKDEASNRVEYWLKLISSFGQNSPVIVVSNQTDQPRKLFLNQGQLTKTYPNIKAFVNTSCKTEQGMDELVRQITHLIDELAHVRDEIPIEWLAVKRQLEGLGKDYVGYDDYVGLCEANDVGKQQEQRVLIRLLHDLGVVLNFQDDARLRDTGVLNPQWVTGAVYKIINAKSIAQNKGILEIGQLDDILVPAEQYPKEKHLFILDMMRKFELCFDLNGHLGERFLIPDLLPSSEPPLSPPVDALNFEYYYDFLPSSVMSRLIVRMNRFIFEDSYWRNGVLLVHNANQVTVKALPSGKKIIISIGGAQKGRPEFWAIIREQFEQIHTSIKGLNAKIKIPVYKRPTCSNCGTSNRLQAKFCRQCGTGLATLPAARVDYSLLLNLQRKGIEEYAVSIGDDVEMINVRELLEGVRAAPKPVEPEEIRAWKKLLQPLQLRVHPQDYYSVTFLLGKQYYEQMGDYTLARQALEDGHQALEGLRSMVEEAIQVQLSSQSAKLYEMLVHSCLVERQEEKAFEYAAAAKGRGFVNKLAKARLAVHTLPEEKADFAAKLSIVRDKRRDIEQLERQSEEKGANRDELLGQQNVLLQEEAELWREMEREYPALTATLSVPSLSAEQAGALASELDATLVEYYRHRGGWCAFVVTKDTIRYVGLSDVNDKLLEKMVSWRNKVHTPQGRSRRRLRWLDRLYEAMVAPLAIESERVIFAPFRELHLLPLWAARQKVSQRYLVEDHVVSYIPSLTALYVVNQEQKRRQSSQVFERLLSVAYPGTPALPKVLEEAQAIANGLSGRVTVHGLHEQLATPENVLKSAHYYDVIHFGCHGNVQSADPTKWGLQLVQPLTISQIITKLDLKRTHLTTLAACLTGQVALREGEEHIGLLQAIMTAGVPTVVASLWSVDDTATRVLFEAFYSRLAMGYAAQEAMRDACKWLRGVDKSWQHPFFWASFAVNGLVLPTQPKMAQAEQWPPTDLAAQIDRYTRESIQHRGEIMKNQLIEEAELLLHDLLYDHEEVLQAFQKHPLSPVVAKKKVVHDRELGFAQALYLIVEDNPALQDFLPPEEEMTQLRNYNLFKRAMSSSQAKPSVRNKLVENSVSDFYEPLKEMLREKDAQTTQSQTSSTN